jgi:hypothetical protein
MGAMSRTTGSGAPDPLPTSASRDAPRPRTSWPRAPWAPLGLALLATAIAAGVTLAAAGYT